MSLIIDVQAILNGCADGGAWYGVDSAQPLVLASDGTVAPYIVWQRIVSTDNVTLAGPTNLQNTRIQVDILAPRIGDAENVRQAVDTALQAAGFPVIPLSSQDLYEPAVKLFRIMREYSLWYDDNAVERLTFTSNGFMLDAYGAPIILRGWNDFRWGTVQQTDFTDTITSGGNFTRFGIRFAGPYSGDTVDAYDPNKPQQGYIKDANLAILDTQVAAAEAAGIWWGFVFDSNCGQGTGDGGSGYCTYDGIVQSNLMNNPAFLERFMTMQAFLVARYRTRKRRAWWEVLAEPNFSSYTNADVKALNAQLAANVRSQDPGGAVLVGANGGYNASWVDQVYDNSLTNAVYTGNVLDPIMSSPSNLQSKVSSLYSLRKTTGSPVFVQQAGIKTSSEAPGTNTLQANGLAYLNTKRIGWAYWERRDSTPSDQYGAYYSDGAGGWIQKPGTYNTTVAAFRS
jgi:hypothetical protein